MNTAAQKSSQERGQATRRLLLQTAIECFSRQGYDASSTRHIETAAGVKRGLISYHFGSKENLWKAAAAHLLERSTREIGHTLKNLENTDPAGRLRFLVRAHVRFCARHPEVNRLMIKEGTDNDWRLRWLVEEIVSPWYNQLKRLYSEAQSLGAAPQMDYHHFYYILTGAATLIFCMAPESKLVAGIDPLDEAVVTEHADALAQLLFPEDPE